ncbi:hypothetical protein [Burkholderia sp. BCC1977]|uniref:hypothetical protein n=1 Tax=Burkholderia sp. BCC1977 TaxID=2817440 RepID=UPI002ABE6194|nr:hypothetical protein [Burkholderia sp. BCC1977]
MSVFPDAAAPARGTASIMTGFLSRPRRAGRRAALRQLAGGRAAALLPAGGDDVGTLTVPAADGSPPAPCPLAGAAARTRMRPARHRVPFLPVSDRIRK